MNQHTGLEIFYVFRRYLGNLKQAHGSFVVDQGSTLDIRLSFVSDFHEELGTTVIHILQNALIDAKVGFQKSTWSKYATYTAPKLSELDTKRYSLPSESN